MAHKIPKIQWANVTLVGTVISDTIFTVSSTDELFVGMVASGAGIPAGTTILSIDSATQITLSQAATTVTIIELEDGSGDDLESESGDLIAAESSVTSITFEFYMEIVFVYPPVEKKGELLAPKQNISTSISGLRQVSTTYIEANRKPTFSFLSQSLFDQLTNFFKTWGAFGKVFRYFEDQLSVSYIEYELDDSPKFDPKKIAPRGPNAYVWEVPLDFRRVI